MNQLEWSVRSCNFIKQVKKILLVPPVNCSSINKVTDILFNAQSIYIAFRRVSSKSIEWLLLKAKQKRSRHHYYYQLVLVKKAWCWTFLNKSKAANACGLRKLKTVIFLWDAWALVRSLRDSTRGLKFATVKLCFRQFSKLFAVSVIFDFENIHPSGNFKGNIPLNRCAGT